MWYSKTEIEKKNNQGYVAEIGHPITNKHFCLLLFCILVPLPNWLSVRSGLMPIFRGEAQTLWSWAPKKQHNLPVGTAVLWNTKAAIRHKPQDSKIANYQIAAHYQNNALPCTIKTPELFCFFSRGRKKKKSVNMQMRAKWEILSVYICIFQVKRTFLGMQVQHPDTAETHCSSCFWMANLPSRGSDIPETQLQDCHTPLASCHLLGVGRFYLGDSKFYAPALSSPSWQQRNGHFPAPGGTECSS